MNRKAILIIDMLNDFVQPKKKDKIIRNIIKNIKKLIYISREKKDLIIYVNDSHIIGEDKELLEWGNHAIKGTKGAKVIKKLKPLKNELIIEKREFSGFSRTNLNDILIRNNINNIIVCGLFADICLKKTCIDALKNNYNIIFLKDCTTNYHDNSVENTIKELKKIGQINDMELNEYVESNKNE